MPSTKDAQANLTVRIEVGMSAKFTVSRENLETNESVKDTGGARASRDSP